MKKKLIFLCIVMIMISLAGALGTKLFSDDITEQEGKITVVTSFYPVYIAAKNVVGGMDNIELINMTDNHTGCLHDYQLTTHDMRKLENAQVFLINGGGIEPFTEDIMKVYPNLNMIDTSTGANFIENEEQNSHVWISLQNYKIQIENIRDGLMQFDKANAETYKENARNYLEQTDMLIKEEQELREQAKNRNVVIFHEGFEYLAEDLNLNVVYEMDLDEEVSLSAGEIAEIIDKIRQYNVKAVFTEEQHKDLIAKSIKGETDADVYVLNTLVSGDGSVDSYLAGMRENIEVIRETMNE